MLIHHVPNGYWTGASQEVDERDAIPIGWIEAPAPPEVPEGKVAMWADGWVITDPPSAPSPTLEELRASANAAVNAKREAVFEAGYPVASGPLEGQHLQLRSADDKANWLIAEKNARAAIAAGAGDVALIPTRTLENNTVVLTPNQTVAVLAGLEAWGVQVMGRSWALKDRNDAAPDADGLVDEATLAAGWP